MRIESITKQQITEAINTLSAEEQDEEIPIKAGLFKNFNFYSEIIRQSICKSNHPDSITPSLIEETDIYDTHKCQNISAEKRHVFLLITKYKPHNILMPILNPFLVLQKNIQLKMISVV